MRGISPVVGAVLMIGVVIAVATIVSLYLTNLITSNEPHTAMLEIITATGMHTGSRHIIYLDVINSGNEPVRITGGAIACLGYVNTATTTQVPVAYICVGSICPVNPATTGCWIVEEINGKCYALCNSGCPPGFETEDVISVSVTNTSINLGIVDVTLAELEPRPPVIIPSNYEGTIVLKATIPIECSGYMAFIFGVYGSTPIAAGAVIRSLS